MKLGDSTMPKQNEQVENAKAALALAETALGTRGPCGVEQGPDGIDSRPRRR